MEVFVFGNLLAAAIVLNPSSSYDRSMSVESCRHAEVRKPCAFLIEAPGYGSKRFKVYKKESNGDLTTLKVGVIDVAGKRSLKFTFEGVDTFNLIVVLFDTKGEPLAIAGAFIDVEPNKGQLGEQYIPSFQIEDNSSDSKPREDSYNIDPLINEYKFIPD